MSPTDCSTFRGYIISYIPAKHISTTMFGCDVERLTSLYFKHPKPLLPATIYLHAVIHPICGKVGVAYWDVSEDNSSPEEIGHGAIPTEVGIVQGDEVDDGHVASRTWRGELEDSLVLVDEVAW